MLIHRPPMGWNSWNTFGNDISDALIRETADAFIEHGLRDAGYEYVTIDDCWQEPVRDPITRKLVPNRKKFPDGMKPLADYIHKKGLKFGIYACAGVRTCTNFPGSFDYEFLDADTFAEFEADLLKYDYCFLPPSASGPQLFHRMGLALENCGRDILFSACNGGLDDVWTWIRSTGAHMYRSTNDIHDNFKSFTDIAMSQRDKFGYSADNCYNDTDMLTVGMYGKGNVGTAGCTDSEYRCQFVLWCMYGAPLMLGCDVRNMTPATKALVTNRALIAIDQDPAARPPVWQNHPWNENLKCAFKHLDGGKYAVACYNFNETQMNVPIFFEQFGLTAASGRALRMTNAETGEEFGTFRDYASVPTPGHDCRVFMAEIVRV